MDDLNTLHPLVSSAKERATKMILFMVYWIKVEYKITKDELQIYQYYVDQRIIYQQNFVNDRFLLARRTKNSEYSSKSVALSLSGKNPTA